MTNTLNVGDKLLINKKISKKDIQRGSIYTFYKDNEYLIKRCIAIGGDHVQIKDNDVYIDGNKLKEDYVSSKVPKGSYDLDFEVPENKVLFLGDNRLHSYDARFWDDMFVDIKDIQGKAIFRLYPFTKIGSIE